MDNLKLTPTQVGQKVADLYSEMLVIRKYHRLGKVTDKGLIVFEREMKSKILEACGMEFLRPGERIFVEVKP